MNVFTEGSKKYNRRYIELVETYKYLGVDVDSKFKWKTHIINLQKKLRKSAYMLHHLSYCSTYDVLRQAYRSLVESYIRQGITARGGSKHCRILQNTQNQLLKKTTTSSTIHIATITH